MEQDGLTTGASAGEHRWVQEKIQNEQTKRSTGPQNKYRSFQLCEGVTQAVGTRGEDGPFPKFSGGKFHDRLLLCRSLVRAGGRQVHSLELRVEKRVYRTPRRGDGYGTDLMCCAQEIPCLVAQTTGQAPKLTFSQSMTPGPKAPPQGRPDLLSRNKLWSRMKDTGQAYMGGRWRRTFSASLFMHLLVYCRQWSESVQFP